MPQLNSGKFFRNRLYLQNLATEDPKTIKFGYVNSVVEKTKFGLKAYYKAIHLEGEKPKRVRFPRAFFVALGLRKRQYHQRQPQKTKQYKKALLMHKSLDSQVNKHGLFQKFSATRPGTVRNFSSAKVKLHIKHFFWEKYFGGTTWTRFYKSSEKRPHQYKLLRFIAHQELRLLPMLMRAQCLKSAAAAYQFIKYGCACINFKVMTYPNAPVKVGDVVTLQMPMQITHAFFSRLYGEKKKHWLWKYRQGLTYFEQLSHIKTSVDTLSKYNYF